MLQSHPVLIAAMTLGIGWAQPTPATATYDLDGRVSLTSSSGLGSGQLNSNTRVRPTVFIHEGNGEGSAFSVGGTDFRLAQFSASGSAGANPLPRSSSSQLSGEFVVDVTALLEIAESPVVGVGYSIDLGISVSDPASSSARASYEVLAFADDLLLANMQGMIDESDLVDGAASLDAGGALGAFLLASDTQVFTLQYTLFGDAMSVVVPEPDVAWLVAAGLLVGSASRRLRPSSRTGLVD